MECVWSGGVSSHLICFQDDEQIAKVTVDAKRLRTPKAPGESDDYAELQIDVSIKVLRPHAATKVGY